MSRADREKWDAKYRAGSHTSGRVSPFLESLDDELPRSGRHDCDYPASGEVH